MAGYSARSLADKLGITSGAPLVVLGAPRGYRRLLEPLPPRTRIAARAGRAAPWIQLFVTRRAELARRFPVLARALAPAGMLWISWPKGTSGVVTDLDENVVRKIGLAARLVDVKVCAVDETWSGLKFVRRLKDRG
jgi:hypothetical protein